MWGPEERWKTDPTRSVPALYTLLADHNQHRQWGNGALPELGDMVLGENLLHSGVIAGIAGDDAYLGRFSQKDPWEGNPEQPLTMNPYLYVLANPVGYVDPAGWYPIEPPGGMCQERPCTIHPVVPYIVDKIRENSTSEEIKRIRELNESHRHEDAWVECQRMPWWQRLLICPQYLEHALDADIGARNAALVEFGCLVADYRLRPTCGRWDYKKEIGERRDLGRNAQRINFCAIGIEEEVIFYYDIWANIHFGYLGMVGGFSEALLLGGAAIEHMGSNLGQTKDDSSDQVCVKIGIYLYGNGLTERALLRQLYIHKHELNKAIVEDGVVRGIYQ